MPEHINPVVVQVSVLLPRNSPTCTPESIPQASSRLGSDQLIAIRVDPGVLDEFRKEARRRRVGYQTLINEVLAQHAGKDVA